MFSNPVKNLATLGLREGMVVADFGCGSGFYVKEASKRVGHTGHVYAIEVQKDLVKKLENELRREKILNTTCIWGDVENNHGTKLKSHSVDAVIVSNILLQVEDKLGLIDEAARILKKEGKLLFVDWSENMPAMHKRLHHKLSGDEVKDLFIKRGFRFLEKITDSSHHYGIIFIYEE